MMTEFSKKETERAATIVTLFGLDALDLFDSLPFATEAEKSDLKKTLGYLEDHFVGKAAMNASFSTPVDSRKVRRFRSTLQPSGKSM